MMISILCFLLECSLDLSKVYGFKRFMISLYMCVIQIIIIYFNTFFKKNDTIRHINISVFFKTKVSQLGEEKLEFVKVQTVFPETNGPNCHIMRK